MLCFYLMLFFFNDTATTEIYTLSLHDALPISASMTQWMAARSTRCSWSRRVETHSPCRTLLRIACRSSCESASDRRRSEEHTSELQSRQYLVCRLLLEKTSTSNTDHEPTTIRA